MKHRRAIYFSLASAVMVPVLCGCKPTEKNYRAAYDAALKKREMSVVDPRAEGHRVISIDGPRTVNVGDRSYALITDFLKSADGGKPLANPEARYRVAVGRYRMPTNARAQVDDLRSSGFKDAGLMLDGKDRYYVIAAGFDSLDEAAACVKKLKEKFPATTFVGLDGDPLIVERP